jgi:hypothetical protein
MIKMKKSNLFFIIFILIFINSLIIFTNATRCSYVSNQDEECDSINGIYCINSICQQYSGNPEGYCTDTDGENNYVKGSITHVVRDEYGNFINEVLTDTCLSGGYTVESCGVRGECLVTENFCLQNEGFSTDTYTCIHGCDDGKCIDKNPPRSWLNIIGTYSTDIFPNPISGKASDSESGLFKVEILIKRESDNKYWSGNLWNSQLKWNIVDGLDEWTYNLNTNDLKDDTYKITTRATDNENNVEIDLVENTIYLIDNFQTKKSCDYQENKDSECDTTNNYYCIDGYCEKVNTIPQKNHCENNELNNGIIYYYRDYSGEIFNGTMLNYCSFNVLTEHYCLENPPMFGLIYSSRLVACETFCFNGKCTNYDIEDITSVSDSELLMYIDKWSNQELGITEQENDNKILQIIMIWKKN